MSNKYTFLFLKNHIDRRYCTYTADDANDAIRQFFISHKSNNDIDDNLFCKLANNLTLEDLIAIHKRINQAYTVTDIFKIVSVVYSNNKKEN